MKHLKKFENLRMLTDWGLLLPEDKFNKYAEEFDAILDGFLEYADMGYKLSFETAYGNAVHMKYDDYLKKNDKYKEFINGLPVRGLFFTSTIEIPYDYKVLLSILEDVQASVDRLGDIGWVMKEFEVKGLKERYLTMTPKISISHSFEKGPRG